MRPVGDSRADSTEAQRVLGAVNEALRERVKKWQELPQRSGVTSRRLRTPSRTPKGSQQRQLPAPEAMRRAQGLVGGRHTTPRRAARLPPSRLAAIKDHGQRTLSRASPSPRTASLELGQRRAARRHRHAAGHAGAALSFLRAIWAVIGQLADGIVNGEERPAAKLG